MVISTSNRSPSPMRSNPNPNPNSNPSSRNNQEREGVGVRKSFSGYPFAKSSISQPKSFIPNTPVNSPAEYARRSSFGREYGVTCGDHEQKENERDPNSKPVARVPSPSISKGCKNFMSPTISAASKINSSPRKKVLGERNEAIRTSASLSDGKFHFFSPSSLEFADENESKVGMETPPCSTMLDFNKLNNEGSNTGLEKKVAELSPGVGKTESESDLVVLSPEVSFSTTTKSFETLPQSEMPKIIAETNVGLENKKPIDSSSPSMVIAPLDAAPSYQPYDPKTNFLSPRPQFLHYKPNPRIENYINQGIRLEDDFASESVSETENSEDVQSEETSSSVGAFAVEEEHPSLELSSPKSQQSEEIVEAVAEPKSWVGGKWKTVTFLFIILLGFISFAMYSSGVGNSIYQDKIISQVNINPRVAADLAKENIKGLLKSSKVWSAQSVVYLSQMIYKQGEVKFSPLAISNLTVWQEEDVGDYLVQGFELRPSFDRKEEGSNTGFEKVAEIEMGKCLEFGEHESFAEEKPLADQVVEEISVLKDVHFSAEISEQPSLFDEAETQESELRHEEYDINSGTLPLTDQVIEASEPEKLEDSEQPSLFDEPESQESEQPSLFDEPENQEPEQPSLFHEPEKQESEDVNGEYASDSSLLYESRSDFSVEDSEVPSQVATASEPFNETVVESSERSLAPITAAVSVVVMSLLAATVFMFVKKPKNEISVLSTPSADHFVQEKKSTCMPLASKIGSKVHENPSWSGPVEVDMLSESCPSELSSFQKTSSYYDKRDFRGRDEAQSEERSSKRNYKRESLASSSSEYTMGSSYGSFTTYSKLHPKNRDDEVVTPVRRSNRIRSKVTSP